MENTVLMDLVDLQTSYMGVLFVTNQDHIPESICRKLESQNACWKKVSIDQFLADTAENKDFGTLVIDTSQITEWQLEDLWTTLKTLEQANIGSILLNNDINFPFDKFKLATMLETALVEEMWGRIETNLAYHKTLSIGGGILEPPSPTIVDDTTEQLKMAGHVQRNFLPQRLPNLKTVRWAALFEPADWVSGDIYDVARLDEQHIGFYIADAVGHSMPAALLTMFLKQAIKMRETTGNDYRIFGPLEVISNLNTAMSDQNLAGCLFATCCYCLLNTRTRQLTFTRAGHPYPVLIRKGQEPVQLESCGGLLGVFDETHFDQKTVQLESGDKVFVYSDGCESLVGSNDDHGQFVFNKDFCSILELPIEGMINKFDKMVDERATKPAEIDDVTAVGFELL